MPRQSQRLKDRAERQQSTPQEIKTKNRPKKRPAHKATRVKPDQQNEAGLDDHYDVDGFEIPFNDKQINCERRNFTGPGAKAALIFTHGAGGGLSAPAAKDFADGFSNLDPIISFQGTMNLASRVKFFHAVIEHEGNAVALSLGGRSMGARAAVIAAKEYELEMQAVILVSYPLVGGQKGDVRDQILLDLAAGVDVLFISGDKDSMCDMDHLNKVRQKMTANSWLIEVAGADHGMNIAPKAAAEKVRRKTGEVAADWIRNRDDERRFRSLRWDVEAEEISDSGWKE